MNTRYISRQFFSDGAIQPREEYNAIFIVPIFFTSMITVLFHTKIINSSHKISENLNETLILILK
jgi:hypothetical protein